MQPSSTWEKVTHPILNFIQSPCKMWLLAVLLSATYSIWVPAVNQGCPVWHQFYAEHLNWGFPVMTAGGCKYSVMSQGYVAVFLGSLYSIRFPAKPQGCPVRNQALEDYLNATWGFPVVTVGGCKYVLVSQRYVDCYAYTETPDTQCFDCEPPLAH